eukprot:gene571-847_t
MSASYPKAFQYYLTRLNNFARQKYRLQTLANTTFNPNEQIVIQLPEGLLDLSTFTLTGLLTTTRTGGTTPSCLAPPIEQLIDSVYIEIGGVAIQSGLTQYNNLFNIFRDFQLWDKKALRGILQNDSNPAATGNDAVLTNKPFAIYNWLGFLGSVKVLDTTLLPPVKVYIRLAPRQALSIGGAAAPATWTYQMTDVKGSIDILDIADGMYYNMVAQRLASAPLEIPYDNFTTVIGGSTASTTQSLRWSTSAHCVEKVIGTLLPSDYNTSSTHNATTRLSQYFTRKGDAVSTSQFFVNGVPYPSIPLDNSSGEVAIDTFHSLGVSADTVSQTNEWMNTLTAFNTHFWTHVHSFTVLDDPTEHRLCGLDGRGNQIIGNWATSGGADNVIPLVFIHHKSVLRIGPSKLVEFVL